MFKLSFQHSARKNIGEMTEYIRNSHKSLSVERFEAFNNGKDISDCYTSCFRLKDNAFSEKVDLRSFR